MWDNLQILGTAPVFNIQLVLNGLSVGAVFALAAYGLALVWGVTSVKNLAQGDFVMMGGYLGYEVSRHGVHPIVAIVPVAVLMFGYGWLLGHLQGMGGQKNRCAVGGLISEDILHKS